MVVLAGVFGDQRAASYRVVRCISTGEARLAISDDYLSELVRVINYPDVERKIEKPARAFEVALDLGTMGIMYYPRRLDWPSLKDPDDGWTPGLAFESGADRIVTRDGDLRDAALSLGFEVRSPPRTSGRPLNGSRRSGPQRTLRSSEPHTSAFLRPGMFLAWKEGSLPARSWER